MKTTILLIIFLFTFSLASYGQEICDNGIDDDGDGLVDLNDSVDCSCMYYFSESLIPNHSFEDTLCCPKTVSALSCAKNWVQPSLGTSDYFNYCNFIDLGVVQIAPLPVFGGQSYVGFADMRSVDVRGDTFGYKEYVGTCLNKSMEAGKEYKIEFYLALGQGHKDFSVSMYASEECDSLPVYAGTGDWFGCPKDTFGWDEIMSEVVIFRDEEWTLVSFLFTPGKNYEAIVFGPSCPEKDLLNDKLSYYYLDHILVNKSAYFKHYLVTASSRFCEQKVVLSTQESVRSNSFQWYKDGVALINETDYNLQIPLSARGNYAVRISFGDTCVLSTSYQYGVVPNFECLIEHSLYNVFTPGTDGKNDTWKVDFEGYSNVQVDIYNRWGELVYEYNLPNDDDWNGKVNNVGPMCPGGTYFYILKLTNPYTDEISKVNGIIELISEQ
ncbi:MAG: gliding motility-associated-like protein [Bacteroidia bacterium]|jgi:gliding motility-associated-like protein